MRPQGASKGKGIRSATGAGERPGHRASNASSQRHRQVSEDAQVVSVKLNRNALPAARHKRHHGLGCPVPVQRHPACQT